MVPFIRVPFWVRIFDPQPFGFPQGFPFGLSSRFPFGFPKGENPPFKWNRPGVVGLTIFHLFLLCTGKTTKEAPRWLLGHILHFCLFAV